MFYQNKRLIFFVTLSIVTVTLLMFSWFQQGKIITNSEESLSIYNPQKSVEGNISLWTHAEIGSRNPFGINRAYPFLVLSKLADLGIPTFLNQAILIGFTMLVSLLSAYLLFNYLSRGSLYISFFGSFFYLLNLYTQTQIFRRFLYNFMFALAYFPLFLFLFIRALETKSWKYLILFAGSTALFSFSFNHPATLFAFAVAALVVFIVFAVKEVRSWKSFFLLIKFVSVAGLLCILFNLWWIYPLTLSSGDYLGTISNTPQSDLELLGGVSPYFSVAQIMMLRQSWWYGESQHWYSFYSNLFIYFISISTAIFTIFGIVKLKSSYRAMIFTLFAVGLFVSKGTNPPFGYAFFNFLFSNLPFTSALRNSYEKFGIVFLLPYAFLFTYGLFLIKEKLLGYKRKVFTVLSVILYLVILVLPMWSGEVFLNSERVKVPDYYSLGNNFLKEEKAFRIFHLPLSSTFDQRYNWGFRGQDPSEYLFDQSSISNTFHNPLNVLFYPKLPELALDKDFPKLLGFLGVSHIVLHNEAQEPEQDALVSKEVIGNWVNINKAAEVGELTIYSIEPQLIRKQFYLLPELPKGNFPDKVIFDDTFTNIEYQKLSLNKYSIKFQNAQKPFYLVFNEKYDIGWRAKINSKHLKHYKIYDLINAWVVNDLGDFEIIVEFNP